jgi:hypothetical protein
LSYGDHPIAVEVPAANLLGVFASRRTTTLQRPDVSIAGALAVQRMNKVQPGDGDALGDALLRIAMAGESTSPHQSLRCLALANLRWLAGNDWDTVAQDQHNLLGR